MKKMARLVVGWLAGVALASAAATLDPTVAALDAAAERWLTAVNARDADALARTMTEDVRLIDAGGTTVTGRDVVIRALADVASRGRLAATRRELTVSGDVGWRVVSVSQTKSGVVHARGQALEIWTRTRGEWRLHRHSSAGLITTKDSLTRPSPDEPVLDRPATGP